MLDETSPLDAKDVDGDPRRPSASAEASVNHDVVALRDSQRTLVLPVNRPHQSEETISSRPDPGTVLKILRRKVAFRRFKVPPVEERIESLQDQSLVSRFLFVIPRHL